MKIFDRRCRVTVDGFAMEGLRVGFTITKDLTPTANSAEIVIYNLARTTRQRMHTDKPVRVVVEAGYNDRREVTRDTPLLILFVGEMREAYSRPEKDGSWATIMRAGDGDKALRKSRRTTGLRPGVSANRVAKELTGTLNVGAGNMWQSILKGKGLGDILAMGFSGMGAAADQMSKIVDSAGMEWSVQDGELQILPAGQVLSKEATILAPDTGLEGTPEIDARGTLTARARIIPGLSPGYPVQFSATSVVYTAGIEAAMGFRSAQLEKRLGAVYRVEKTRYVGDTHGQDWTAEITAIDPRVAAANAARAAAKAKKAAAPTTPVTP
jgi:hypothetical protein